MINKAIMMISETRKISPAFCRCDFVLGCVFIDDNLNMLPQNYTILGKKEIFVLI